MNIGIGSLSAKGNKIISVDFFDTLVKRKCLNPIDIFPLVCARLKEKKLLPKYFSSSRFSRMRVEAERIAREKQYHSSGNHEVTLDEIYQELICLQGNQDIKDFIQVELEVETDNIFINPYIINLLKERSNNGSKIIITSDTYFSKSDLTTIINKKSVGKYFDEIYVSSEFRSGKYSNLFEKICHLERVGYNDILHFGDNYGSDVERPLQLGINAYHSPNGDAYIWDIVSLESNYLNKNDSSDIDHGFYDYGLMNSIRCMLVSNSYLMSESCKYEIFGKSVIGPLVYLYLRWVLLNIEDTDNHVLLGLYREGATIADMMKIISPDSNVEKLGVSRKIINLIGLSKGITRDKLQNLIPERGSISVSDFLNDFRLSPDLIPDNWKGLYLRKGTSFADKFIDFILESDEITSRIKLTTQLAEIDFSCHLNKVNSNNSENIILLDLGWGGSIQRKLIEYGLIEKDNVIGLYLAMNEGADSNNPIKKSGFVFDGVSHGTIERFTLNFVEILEQVMTPPCGSTIGHFNGEPIFGEKLIPAQQESQIASIQRGIKNFIEYASSVSFAKDWDEERLRRIARTILTRLSLNPVTMEQELFKDWKHDDNTIHAVEDLSPKYMAPFVDYLSCEQILVGDFAHYYWIQGLLSKETLSELKYYSNDHTFGAKKTPDSNFRVEILGGNGEVVVSSSGETVNRSNKFLSRLWFDTDENILSIRVLSKNKLVELDKVVVFYEYNLKRSAVVLDINDSWWDSCSDSGYRRLNSNISIDFEFDKITGIAVPIDVTTAGTEFISSPDDFMYVIDNIDFLEDKGRLYTHGWCIDAGLTEVQSVSIALYNDKKLISKATLPKTHRPDVNEWKGLKPGARYGFKGYVEASQLSDDSRLVFTFNSASGAIDIEREVSIVND